MRKLFSFFFLVLIFSNLTPAQNNKILEANNQGLKIEVNFNSVYQLRDTTIDSRVYQMIYGGEVSARNPGEPWLPEYCIYIAIPFNSDPTIQIIQNDKTVLQNKFILPFPEENPQFTKINTNKFDRVIYSSNKLFPDQPASLGSDFIIRYSRIVPLKISPFLYNPVTHELIASKSIVIRVVFNAKSTNRILVDDRLTRDYLKSSVINFGQALQWTGKNPSKILYGGRGNGNYWYDPNKNYFKIYLKNKGIYRLTFDQLVSSGVPIQGGISSNALELVNDGNSVPIDVVDGGDGQFNSGDYFQFVGSPPTPTPYCNLNIYNNTNIYWFSYQSDTLSARYHIINGYPSNSQNTVQYTLETTHYERDSIYERLGYSNTLNIDHWYWDKVTGDDGVPTHMFNGYFPTPENFNAEEHYLKVSVNLTGMNNYNCSPDHHVNFNINNQPIGELIWDNQTNITFQKQLYISADSIHIFPESNYLQVSSIGDVCDTSHSDECRVNWFDLQYYRYNRTHGNNFIFSSSPGQNGIITYQVWLWNEDNMKIYIPAKQKLIVNPQFLNDSYHSVLFSDTVSNKSEFYCVASNFGLTPDSIKHDEPSNLRSPNNGADYIIITHPDFMDAAQRLKTLRETQYPDSGIIIPRVQIVDINQIYDEFSYGLLNPQALQDFVKYAFENWESPAPVYVVLFGDMSHDYRHLLTTSRPNFIPSMPYYATTYGEAESDNLIVAVEGGDLKPDLVIGRLSCETPEEAGVLMDKLEHYPQDNGKSWKQDVMLAASGLYLQDEIQMGFNRESNYLADNYLIPNGIHPSRVFNFPTNAVDSQYIGGGPKIRQEIDEGVVLGNYFGHGGGYQWDLIFTNDDIDALNNPGRLPVILSVTCYTAHFDDQNVFGEQFNKLPGKGSIGFFGNIGLTYWQIGVAIDRKIFNEIFNFKNYTIGKAIFNAKNQVSGGGYYGQQITLLTYLGDPALKLALPDKPDFVITSSDISISKQNPLVNDTTQIKARINNLGIVFPNDTINVQVFATSADTSYLIATKRLPSFGELDSVIVDWIPDKAALYTIKVEVNELDPIPEDDHSDNVAVASFAVYNISEANVLTPQDGFSSSDAQIKFEFIDIGDYINLNLTYYIEIDTSLIFESPMIKSSPLTPSDGVLTWIAPALPQGAYFWRVRIYDGTNFGQWSGIRSFSIVSEAFPGFYSYQRGLKLFNTYNIYYSDSASALRLNTALLPPRPSNASFRKDIHINDPVADSVDLTAITTDGTYIYFANIWYYAGNSKIYKIGTGHNGTVEGQFYGEVPNFYGRVANSLVYHSDGFLYVTTNDPYHIKKISAQNGDTSSIFIPSGLLNWETGKPTFGTFYLKSDGQYMYNLTLFDSVGHNKYILRVLDPQNNWQLVKPDIALESTPFVGFTDFFVADNYVYTSEHFLSNYMRRIRVDNGVFEEEWISYQPFQGYYGWCYDWINDQVIASVFYGGKSPKFSVFKGRYVDASGTITTRDIGPASQWLSLNYNLDQNNSGSFTNILYGLNRTTKIYDTLATNVPFNYSLAGISPTDYQYLRMSFKLTDTTFNITNPMQLNNVNVNFKGLPEIMITKNNLKITPDSVLQGLNTTMHFTIKNLGFVSADSVNLDFYLNGSDSLFYNSKVNIQPDSTVLIEHTFSTAPFIFDNNIKAVATYPKSEYFTFNNITDHNFYVVRDSTNPVFNITFDGKEIINGDLVSSKPEVVITLKDNSPLPLDTSYFTLIHTEGGYANILHFSDPDLDYSYTQYPNSESRIVWHPDLKEGEHILEILAKDASGNFFDTTSYRITFEVVTEYDLRDVYNYPNPFKDGTYFTFKLTGDKLPDELYVKIYTVAGRLIRTIKIPNSELGQDLGFKKIYWDGKDEDGDEIANGVYFYKMIYKVKDVEKAVTQKLAKIR
jgi:hypothetical protein